VDTALLAADLTRDTRDEMHDWIRENLPPDAVVSCWGSVPAYLPSPRGLDQTLYLRFQTRAPFSPDYILASSLDYDRYLDYPDQMPVVTTMHQDLFRLELAYEARPKWRTYQFHEPVLRLYRAPDGPGPGP
jgi:hypothetical protein